MKKIVLFLFPTLLCIGFFYFISSGFYFTGDTVSYLEHAFQGSPLTTFLLHAHEWPPFTSIIFNILRIFGKSLILQQKIYVIFVFFASLSGLFLIMKKIGWKHEGLLIACLLVFSSTQLYLFQSALSENLFIMLWIWSTYFFLLFVTEEQEKYLFFCILPASLMPFTRYIGIAVLFAFCMLMFITILKKRKKSHISPYFVFSAMLLVWIPILFYLLRNKIGTGSLFGTRDQTFGISIVSTLIKNASLVVIDLWLPAIMLFLLGVQLRFKREQQSLFVIIFISAIYYFFSTAYSETKYFVVDNFPSRYMSVLYPFILLLFAMAGAYLNSKIHMGRRFLLVFSACVGIYLISMVYNNANFIYTQLQSSASIISGPEYSKNIEEFCHTEKTKSYLLIQQYSRNHIARSLQYYCKPIEVISDFTKKYTLATDDIIYTPYNLTMPFKLEKTYVGFGGRMEVGSYRAEKNITTDFNDLLRTLHYLN